MLLAIELSMDGLKYLLFENPGWAIVVIAIVWAFLRITGRRMKNKKMQHASWVALALILGLWASSHFVVTPREQLMQTQKQLLDAVEQQDMRTFRRLVTQDAVALFPPGDNPQRFTRQEIEDQLAGFDIGDIALLGMATPTSVDGSVASVYIRIRVEGEAGGFGGIQFFTWKLDWQYANGQWQVTRLTCEEAGFDLNAEPLPQ